MKRFLVHGFVLLLAICMMPCLYACASDEEADEIEVYYAHGQEVQFCEAFAYILVDGEATIVGHIGSTYEWNHDWPEAELEKLAAKRASDAEAETVNIGSVLVVPSQLDGHPVTTIGDLAFSEGFYNDVVIEEGIVSIGDWAFGTCYYINAFTIPQSVTFIDEHFFGTTHGFIANTVFRVSEGSYAARFVKKQGFPYTYDLAYKVYVSDAWRYTLEGGQATLCGYLGKDVDIQIPEQLDGYPVTAIAQGEYYNETSYTFKISAITIPDSVVAIGDGAFRGEKTLTSVVIPAGCMSFGSEAFAECPNLTLTLTVTKGSYGEQYARENGIPFVFGTK